MWNYISGAINKKNYIDTYSIDLLAAKPDLPEHEIDSDYYIAANYFLKYAADPNTPKETQKILNNIIIKNPNLISEIMRIVHETTQAPDNAETLQEVKQNSPIPLSKLKLQREELREKQKQILEKVQTNVQSYQLKFPSKTKFQII